MKILYFDLLFFVSYFSFLLVEEFVYTSILRDIGFKYNLSKSRGSCQSFRAELNV